MAVPGIYHDGSSPQELYFISSIDNADSILQKGILSHKRAHKRLGGFQLDDISNTDLQEQQREGKIFSNPRRSDLGKKPLQLHQYANLYIRAHNAMLYVRREKRDNLCVFRIDPRILSRSEVMVANQNAAKDAASFFQSTSFQFSPGSSLKLKERHSIKWEDKTKDAKDRRKAIKQAEVLAPYQINPSFIRGAYVANEKAREILLAKLTIDSKPCPIPVDLHPSLFFLTETKDYQGANLLSPIIPSPLTNSLYPEVDMALPDSSEDEAETGPKAAADPIFPMDEG